MFGKLRDVVAVVPFLVCAVSFAQELSWTTDTYDSQTTNVTGQSTGQPGVASAVFNNEILIAYLDSNTCSGNLCEIMVKNNGGGNLYFEDSYDISVPTGIVTANANPTMAVYSGVLYLAYTDANNNNWIIASSDGRNWTGPYQVAAGNSTWYSPVMASTPYGLFVAFMSGSTKTPIICQVYANTGNIANSTQQCKNFTSWSAVNYNPGLVYWNGELYVGFSASGSNCLDYYELNPSAWTSVYAAWNPPGQSTCAQQTNAAPSLEVYNGNLYIGSRANNNGKDFTVTSVPTSGNATVQVLNFGMPGPANLLAVPSANMTSPAPPFLINFYEYENRLYYTYGK